MTVAPDEMEGWSMCPHRPPSMMKTWKKYFWMLSMNLVRVVRGEAPTLTGKELKINITFTETALYHESGV